MGGQDIVRSIYITRILRGSMIVIETQRRSIFPKDKIQASNIPSHTTFMSRQTRSIVS